MGKFCDRLWAKQAAGQVPVIVDFKAVSPRDGDLFQGRDTAECARMLKALGAPALSVVTAAQDFGGSLDLLRTVAGAVDLPILRKDFIQSRDDLLATRDAGATAVLLICACLQKAKLFALYDLALSMGLEPLVEVHYAREMALCRELGAGLVGVNNRNILELEKDNSGLRATKTLAPKAPAGALVISESGISAPDQVRSALDAGAHAVLVGTALWQAPDMAALYRQLCAPEA